MSAVGDPELDHRNRQFQWQSPPGGEAQSLTAEQLRRYDEQAFFKLEQVFTADEIAAVMAAIDPLEAEHEALVRNQGGKLRLSATDTITFAAHLVERSATLRQFAGHRLFREVCRDLIGPQVRLYWDQSVYKKSGRPQEFPWHQDNGYTYVEPQQYLTFWIPLVNVTLDNGCPWIAPGMHRRGTLRHWPTPLGMQCLEDVAHAVPVPAEVGDVIVFSSLAPHRTGPNLVPGTVRKAYILQYAPDGAVAHRDGGPATLQNDPRRQFKVVGEES